MMSTSSAMKRRFVWRSADLSKRSTLDKWKINVIAAIKRKLDKKAGVDKAKDSSKNNTKEETMKGDTHNPDFSPF